MDHVLFNPGPDSVVYSADGRAVDAQDRIRADAADPLIKRLVDHNQLIDQGPDAEIPGEELTATVEPGGHDVDDVDDVDDEGQESEPPHDPPETTGDETVPDPDTTDTDSGE